MSLGTGVRLTADYLDISYNFVYYVLKIDKDFSLYENLVVNVDKTHNPDDDEYTKEVLASDLFAQEKYCFYLSNGLEMLSISKNVGKYNLELINQNNSFHVFTKISEDDAKFIYKELKKELYDSKAYFNKISVPDVLNPTQSWVYYDCIKTTYTLVLETSEPAKK